MVASYSNSRSIRDYSSYNYKHNNCPEVLVIIAVITINITTVESAIIQMSGALSTKGQVTK